METNSNADSDLFSQSNPMPEPSQSPETPAEPSPAASEQPAAAEALVEAVPDPAVELTVSSRSDEATPETAAAEPAPSDERSEEPASETPETTRGESSTELAPQAGSEPSDAPQPEGASAERSAETGTPASEDPLLDLAIRAQAQRLAPAEEERAGALLREALLDGRAGVIRAIDALSKLPWIVGVNAVTAVWPELKPAFRTQLFGGLARMDSDNARRMRLSLARGLYKQDIPVALKIATNVAKEIRDKETGAISPKHAQIFANVLIGRAKPWIGQVSLTELRPVDAEALVHCALMAAFTLPHAPITQLGVLKWATEAGRMGKVHQTVIDAAAKTIGRWSAKWQNALRKEVSELPEAITAVLKGPGSEPQQEKPEPDAEAAGAEARAGAEIVTPDSDADGDAEEAAVAAKVEGEEPDAEDAEAPHPTNGGERPSGGRAPQKQRPVYESKTIPRKAQGQSQSPAPEKQQPPPQQQQQQQQQQRGGGQSLREAPIPDLLRAVEAQFQALRSELQRAETKLRQKEEDLRRAQKKTVDRASLPVIEGEPTPEELARLNRQLENRNLELQARIEELTADAEARAVSVGAVNDQPVEDPNAQLRTLLVLKLQEDYEDFVTLEKESPDIVVQQHYRTVLRHVFEVLTTEGVKFAEPAPLP